MRKNFEKNFSARDLRQGFKKFRTLGLTLLIVLCGVFYSAAAETYSQVARLTLNQKNTTIRNVLNTIEDQTEFYFMYNGVVVDVDRVVSIEVNNELITNVLNKLFAGTDIAYIIKDRQIALTKINSPSETPATQQSRVRGKVSTPGGEPVIGATVVIKGTTTGTTTNIDGSFDLPNVPANATLVFSFVGMKSLEVAYKGQASLNVVMEEQTIGIEEVVAVGYGNMKKGDLSGASVSVSENTVKGSISSGLDQALQGRAAGVTAVQTSGQPGSSTSIRIRGTSTLNADAEPLYVIDGVPISSSLGSVYDVGLGAAGGGGKTAFSALSSINPSDIISIEILKDASATAIYGSRGANGVVLITTRRGKANEAKFTYEGMYGVQQQVERLKLMNLREFAEYQNDLAAETNGRVPRPEFADPSLLGEGTNWQNEIFRTAPMQSHNITATGGSNVAQYALSGGYFQQDGTVIGSDFSRVSFRANVDSEMKSWLKVGTSLMLSKTEDHIGLFDQTGGIIQTAAKQTPDVPVRNFDGTYATAVGEGAVSRVNPIAKALDEENRMTRTRLLGNLYADVSIIKGLTFRTEFGGDLGFTNGYSFQPTYQYGSQRNDQNSASKRYNQNQFW